MSLYYRNVHIYPSTFTHESRMLKITNCLKKKKIFGEIWILAIWERGLSKIERIDETRTVIRLPRGIVSSSESNTAGKTLGTIIWYLKVLLWMGNKRIDCLNCHRLSILPLCVILKLIKRCKLIYDTHELETETISNKGIRKVFSKFIERMFIRFTDEIIVVNDEISEWYKQEYRLNNVHVIKNYPYRKDTVEVSDHFREVFGLGSNDIIFLYQGAISKGRGIVILAEIFSKMKGNLHIVFMGFGSLKDLVVEYSKQCSNVHYHEAVKPEEIDYYTASADVGLCLIENKCLNYYYSLPNKMFQYLQCGLPIIISNFPAMSRFVNKFGGAWKVKVESDAVESVIRSITRKDIEEKQRKVFNARTHIGWDLEEKLLLSIYNRNGFP